MNISDFFPTPSEADKLRAERYHKESRELDEYRRKRYVFARQEVFQDNLDKLSWSADRRSYIEMEALPAVRTNLQKLKDQVAWARTVMSKPPASTEAAHYEKANDILSGDPFWLRELEDTERWLLELQTALSSAEAELVMEGKEEESEKQERGDPNYVKAIFDNDCAILSGRNDRPYKWLLDATQFGTLIYCYLRGSKDGKRLSMKHVSAQWVDRDGEIMNYDSLKTRKDEALEGRLPELLDKALADAGYPYTPPSKQINRPHTGKIDRVIMAKKKVNYR